MLKVSNLVCREGEQYILSGITFEVGEGEIFGLVGPNGSGKTAVFRCIAGLCRPDVGEVYLDGVPLYRVPWPRKPLIGYAPKHCEVADHLSVLEIVSFYAATHGFHGKTAMESNRKILDFCHLASKADYEAARLPADDQKLVSLACVLTGRPKYVVLDEPTTGMDPGHRRLYVNCIKELAKDGVTVLVSSHNLADMDPLCDSIGIINHGVLVRSAKSDRIMLEADQENPILITVLGKSSKACGILRKQEKVLRMTSDETRIAVWFSGSREEETELLSELIRSDIPVVSFAREHKNLETLFFHLTDQEKSS